MKIGKSQQLTTATFTSTPSENSGKEAENILDSNTLKVWGVTGADATLLVQIPTITFDTIALFNLTIRTSITINLYSDYPGSLIQTETIIASDFIGNESKNLFIDVDAIPQGNADGFILGEYILDEYIVDGRGNISINYIEIICAGNLSNFQTSIGYLWLGDLIDFGCAEKIQPFDQSQDDVTVTRGNNPDVNERYDIQAYNVTLKKENDYETLRGNIRLILSDGFGTPRPYIIDEPFLSVDEVLLGIMDSGKVGYDIISTDSGFIAQTTIGIREVF